MMKTALAITAAAAALSTAAPVFAEPGVIVGPSYASELLCANLVAQGQPVTPVAYAAVRIEMSAAPYNYNEATIAQKLYDTTTFTCPALKQQAMDADAQFYSAPDATRQQWEAAARELVAGRS